MDFSIPVGEDKVIEMNAALAEKKDYTTEYLDSLPENVRAELIDGQIYYFAAPKVIHQELVGELYFTLRSWIAGKKGECKVLVAPISVRLNCDDRTSVEPDVIVVCDKEKLHEDGCYGAPDLMIEVSSKSTRRRDYGIKMLKYRTAGVKEYWIVDPDRRTVTVSWFEDESQNCLYSFDDEISFHLFPGLSVRVGDWMEQNKL